MTVFLLVACCCTSASARRAPNPENTMEPFARGAQSRQQPAAAPRSDGFYAQNAAHRILCGAAVFKPSREPFVKQQQTKKPTNVIVFYVQSGTHTRARAHVRLSIVMDRRARHTRTIWQQKCITINDTHTHARVRACDTRHVHTRISASQSPKHTKNPVKVARRRRRRSLRVNNDKKPIRAQTMHVSVTTSFAFAVAAAAATTTAADGGGVRQPSTVPQRPCLRLSAFQYQFECQI